MTGDYSQTQNKESPCTVAVPTFPPPTAPESPFTSSEVVSFRTFITAMEQQMMVMSAMLMALLVSCASALPADDSMLQRSALSVDKRPKYMDTRDLDIFKYMLMASIRDLVDDGQLNSGVLSRGSDDDQSELKAVVKRMQYMGICMRRRQNTFIPYPCLRSA
ncbi:hypothetical protein ACOMHN_047643 [Nucella lapillus]